MIKRASWFVAGAAAGVSSSVWAQRKVKRQLKKLTPEHIAVVATDKVKGKAHDVADAVRHGRDAMKAKEAELRAVRDGLPVVAALPPAEARRPAAIPVRSEEIPTAPRRRMRRR